ncbi:hypothetical protein BJV77DRAFT_1065579 [Russula vinacea]|nr:hypothetical protein BJV77DRAFT_1065579 [Russula vinacea]
MSVTRFSPTTSPPVLSWDIIIAILSEEDYMSDREDIKNESGYLQMSERNFSPTTHDPDIASLHLRIRQLCLTVAQTYIKLWPNTSGSFVLESIEVCSQVLSDAEPTKKIFLHLKQNPSPRVRRKRDNYRVTQSLNKIGSYPWFLKFTVRSPEEEQDRSINISCNGGGIPISSPSKSPFSEDLQAIAQTSTDAAEYENDLDSAITRLGVDGIAYLQTRSPQGVNPEAELEIDPVPIQQLILEQPSEKFARQLGVNVWNVLLLAALFHKSPGPGALLMKHFPAFITAYRESLAASASVTHGIVNAAANINHCYGSVKLWLLLERMLSRTPELPDGHASIPKAMPFVIWNALWTPFLDLIAAYEADVSRGQDTRPKDTMERHIFVIADLFQFLKEFHSVLALETAVHEATLNRLGKFGQPEGSSTKLARMLRMIREPMPMAPWTTLLDQVKGDVIAAEKLDLIVEPREPNRVPNFEKQRRDSHAA